MRLSNVKRAVATYGIPTIGILFIIVIVLVNKEPNNLIIEDGNIQKELNEVLDIAKKLHINAVHDDHKNQPVVWIRIAVERSFQMNSVKRVFERLGYKQGSQFSKWDVLWSYNDPFQVLESLFKTIGPHQKVNHIPGAMIFQDKKNLVTSIDIQSIPKSFSLPSENSAFQNYARRHPDYMWVQKNEAHQGISMVKPEAVKFDKNKKVVQRFIHNPLLIDGKKFEIGIFVAVTSVDPLRVYMHDNDWVIRSCPEVYDPFDPKNVKKYVVANDSIPAYKMPLMKKLVLEKGFSYKEALLSHLRTNGYNDTKLLNNLHDSIKELFTKIQHKLVIDPSSHLSSRNFFDISRFDFIIDKDINVHLMGANLSPNLILTFPDFNGDGVMHDQVIYSLLTMIGIGRNTQKHFMTSSNDSQQMMVSEGNIHVYSDLCASSQCENNCQDIYCNLCSGCQDDDFSLDLKHTVMEHSHRGDWRRIFPRVFKDPMEAKKWDPLKDPGFQKGTSKNKRMAAWIRGICMRDDRWCF